MPSHSRHCDGVMVAFQETPRHSSLRIRARSPCTHGSHTFHTRSVRKRGRERTPDFVAMCKGKLLPLSRRVWSPDPTRYGSPAHALIAVKRFVISDHRPIARLASPTGPRPTPASLQCYGPLSTDCPSSGPFEYPARRLETDSPLPSPDPTDRTTADHKRHPTREVPVRRPCFLLATKPGRQASAIVTARTAGSGNPNSRPKKTRGSAAGGFRSSSRVGSPVWHMEAGPGPVLLPAGLSHPPRP